VVSFRAECAGSLSDHSTQSRNLLAPPQRGRARFLDSTALLRQAQDASLRPARNDTGYLFPLVSFHSPINPFDPTCTTPSSPYRTFPGGLAAGESNTVNLEFTKVSTTAISYNTRVLQGPGAP